LLFFTYDLKKKIYRASGQESELWPLDSSCCCFSLGMIHIQMQYFKKLYFSSYFLSATLSIGSIGWFPWMLRYSPHILHMEHRRCSAMDFREKGAHGWTLSF